MTTKNGYIQTPDAGVEAFLPRGTPDSGSLIAFSRAQIDLKSNNELNRIK